MRKRSHRTLTSILLFIVVLFLAKPTFSQEYKVRMAMLGNSITYGALLSNPASECYSAQLGTMLSEIYGDTCEIMNCGVSARTMMRSAEVPLWNEDVFKSALEFVPDICLILLGTNDSKPYRWEAWGDEFQTDYLAMIDTFKYRNPATKFIVCYPPPIWEGHPYGDTFNDSHNDSILVNAIIPIIDSVAEITNSLLIDFHTPFIDSLQFFPDKLHPDIEGSRIMAEIIYNKILDTDIIHRVETGKAYVATFNQLKSPVAIGDSVELQWSTMFADSVFLDNVLVESSGSMKVLAEENKQYEITAKSSKNTSTFYLTLNTYVPEASEVVISASSNGYRNGEPVTLYVAYVDQFGNNMFSDSHDLIWSISGGEGSFSDQTDTSIVFTPESKGKFVIEASEGELTGNIKLGVNSVTAVSTFTATKNITVYPNPVDNVLNFQLENLSSKDIQINVFDVAGEKVAEEIYKANIDRVANFILNVSHLESGLYFYTISIDSEVINGKFTKVAEN